MWRRMVHGKGRQRRVQWWYLSVVRKDDAGYAGWRIDWYGGTATIFEQNWRQPGVSSDFIESSNLDAKVSAHYFVFPTESEDKPLFAKKSRKDLFCHMEENLRRWRVGMGKLGVSAFSALLPAHQMHWMKYPVTIIDLRNSGWSGLWKKRQ